MARAQMDEMDMPEVLVVDSTICRSSLLLAWWSRAGYVRARRSDHAQIRPEIWSEIRAEIWSEIRAQIRWLERRTRRACSRFVCLLLLVVVVRISSFSLARTQRSDGFCRLANRDWCEAGMLMKKAGVLYVGISTIFWKVGSIGKVTWLDTVRINWY